MHIDILGRIRNTNLPASHGLMPVFEAIVNSIHAIEERGNKDGLVRVRIERDGQQQLAVEPHGNTLATIRAFVIEDNGAGFTPANYKSFETADSRAKVAKGGKGVGRITWLKAFDYASVESDYQHEGTWWRRSFEFRPTDNGIEKHELSELAAGGEPFEQRTRVRLVGFSQRYREAVPKSAETIARRIVEHCLEYFLLGTERPRLLVTDSEAGDIDLNSIFAEDCSRETKSRAFVVGSEGKSQDLAVTDVFLRNSADARHALHFCAHNRVVETVVLNGKVPHLEGPLLNVAGEAVFYNAYVHGPFLDESVNPARTGFQLDRDDSLPLEGGPTWEKLRDAALVAAAEFLEPFTRTSREQSIKRIRDYIELEAPRYRPLLEHRAHELERLSGALSPTSLDLELYKLLSNWRMGVRRDAAARLRDVKEQPSTFETHKEQYRKLFGELQEVQTSDLAEYVIHRATVLTFLEALLGRQDDGRFAREDALHDLVFPRRKTSKQVDHDEHNLWVIDERLAYHRFLASDIPFDHQRGPVSVDSDDRPDILIYNNPFAMTSGEQYGSVIIIEFKRPERADVVDDKSPIKQALRYAKQIRDGKAQRPDGSTVRVPPTTPYYCYVIASLTDKLREDANEHGFTEAPDGNGYFFFNTSHNAYIEVSDYRKILIDAKKRNQAFFERLQIRLS